MMYLKRTLTITILLLLAMAVAACGSSTSSGSSSTTSSTPTTAATTPSNSNAIVKTSTVTVSGKSETVLTNAQGKTLYYFKPDTATTSACTQSCADNWPPLLATGSASPTSITSLPGTLSMQTTANGNQVAYNGHFLYTFAGDSGPGQAKGQGLFGKWFVVTPDLAAGNTSTGSGSNSTPVVKTSTATVNGKSETILTDAQGKTLYYFTPDTATTAACTGSCAQNWPPLLSTGSGTPTSATTLSGKLTVQTTANGSQIEYNGHLLYTFAADSAPGQTNGEGVLGKWFVATPTLS